jgi:hypothetical protein
MRFTIRIHYRIFRIRNWINSTALADILAKPISVIEQSHIIPVSVCPFTCSFCAVVPIYNARWKGKSAELIYRDILWFKEDSGADAIEFHERQGTSSVSEKRTDGVCEIDT